MRSLLVIVLVVILVPLVCAIVYIKVMAKKQQQYPLIDFKRFQDNENMYSLKELEHITNQSIKGSVGWITLATFYSTLYYLLNIWSMLFGLLDLFAVAYHNELRLNLTMSIIVFSLLSVGFNVLDLWLDSKRKAELFHNNWFSTAIIIKNFIVELQLIGDKNCNVLCLQTKKFLNDLHASIKDTAFF
jgi:hypothetical protein